VAPPYNLSFAAPALEEGVASVTITATVRARDTGGNESLSNEVAIEVVRDTFAPSIVESEPAPDEVYPAGLLELGPEGEVTFDPDAVFADGSWR
jgi:hypothetical protein